MFSIDGELGIMKKHNSLSLNQSVILKIIQHLKVFKLNQ